MNGRTLQVRYDDPESLAGKVTFARDQDLRGVGVWNTEALDYTSTHSRDLVDRRLMWNTLPSYKNRRH